MTKFTKTKAQMKSSSYYLFWGIATIAVVAGQFYVGNGYRRMAETGQQISADINLLIEYMEYGHTRGTGPRTPKGGLYEPMLPPPTNTDPWKSMPIIQ